MIDLNDLQKPAAAVLVVGAAAATGFVAGYLVGRDPELARRLARTLAGGLTRLQVAAAEAWENLGDLWADARAQAQRDIEAERFADDTGAPEAAPEATAPAKTPAPPAGGKGAAARSRRRRAEGAASKRVSKTAKAPVRPVARSRRGQRATPA
jgi:hypothetical protein